MNVQHEPEFHKPTVRDTDSKARELSACYARVFLGDEDGKRVLADLRAKFGVGRLCFKKSDAGRFDYLAAALVDGERRVMSEIEGALQLGAPGQALSEPKPNQ
jgi:hypothetical protein